VGVLASGKLEKGGSDLEHGNLSSQPCGLNESRPAELGQQPEASLAWGGVILTAKRRQRVPMPCD
jgi:hypothetical protein